MDKNESESCYECVCKIKDCSKFCKTVGDKIVISGLEKFCEGKKKHGTCLIKKGESK